MLQAVQPPLNAPYRNPAFLDAAGVIARRLGRDAIWSGDRCTWFGWSMEPDGYGNWRPVRRTMGPELYSGLAGVALFLSHYVRLSGDDDARAVRDGALRQIEARVASMPVHAAFYGGLLGVGYALATIGELDGDDALVARGLAEVDRAVAAPLGPEAIDLMSGRAGAIPPLIDLAARFDRPDLLAVAQRYGGELVDMAVESAEGLSWPTLPAGTAKRNLLGFSHGVAGIAWALLELNHVRADARFVEAAREALRYERSFFDPAQRNWPDLRDMSSMGTAVANPGQPSFAIAWCHGAAGIGLSRMRLIDLLPGDAEIAGEVEAAMTTVSAAIKNTLEAPVGYDMTPCHGVAGNAETALFFAQRVGRQDAYDFIEAVGRSFVDRYVRTKSPFPCGVLNAGETPGLMLGLAGIGYFFLRLFAPADVPSILLVVPAASKTRDRRKR